MSSHSNSPPPVAATAATPILPAAPTTNDWGDKKKRPASSETTVRTDKNGEPLSEKRLRRLEKNRLSARECRRRKREATENLQREINLLEGENLRLRLQLQVWLKWLFCYECLQKRVMLLIELSRALFRVGCTFRFFAGTVFFSLPSLIPSCL